MPGDLHTNRPSRPGETGGDGPGAFRYEETAAGEPPGRRRSRLSACRPRARCARVGRSGSFGSSRLPYRTYVGSRATIHGHQLAESTGGSTSARTASRRAPDLDRRNGLCREVEVPARVTSPAVVRRGEDHRVAITEELREHDRPWTPRTPTGRREQEDVPLPRPRDAALGAAVDPHTQRREPPVEGTLDDEPETLLARQASRGLPAHRRAVVRSREGFERTRTGSTFRRPRSLRPHGRRTVGHARERIQGHR